MARIVRLAVFLIIIFVSAACAPTASTVPTVQATRSPQTAPESALNPPRPDAPASGEDFRRDHPVHVAATGKPQLIEFFADT
jgi:hypothetical protein